MIRLDAVHYGNWKKRYHAIPDFDAELASLDHWYQHTDSRHGKDWFHRAPRSLNEKHQKLLANRRDNGPDLDTIY